MSAVAELLALGRVERTFNHASLCIVREGDVLLEAGDHGAYDVASVTKVVTSVLVHRHLDLSRRVEWIASRPTIGELLSHASGLPAWRPLFAHAACARGVSTGELVARRDPRSGVLEDYRALIAATPCNAPRPTYSDLGFVALGLELEAGGVDLSAALEDELGMRFSTWATPPAGAWPTGVGRPRRGNPAIESEVVAAAGEDPAASDGGPDDDNAAATGRPCGHAGIWSTARELARLGDRLRRAADDGDASLLNDRSAALLFSRAAGSRTAGLDTPSGDAPSIGSLLGRGALGAAGHQGFTGCSLWIDRDARVSIALLSDAVVIERPSVAIRALRPRLHDALAKELALASSS